MSQISLFDDGTVVIESIKSEMGLNNKADLAKIDGLLYIPNFINQKEERILWQSINSEKWLNDLKRRVQHYGYKYDYKSRFIDYTMKIGSLPSWGVAIAQRLYEEAYMGAIPDQLIVNEYIPGQGIANHIDCEPCFGNTIASLSLGSPCVMDFINRESKETITVLLEPRSLIILRGSARYNWTHGIRPRKTDVFNDLRYERETRISLTFRSVRLFDCE